MSTNILFILLGVLIGLVVMGLAVWFTMPSLMLIRHKTDHRYDQALDILNAALQKKPDWRLLKVNNYQETTAPFVALEKTCSLNVCNPRYASKILSDDANRGVTAFMPLSIGVYENKHGQVYVSRLNVSLLGMMFGGTIAKVMKMAGSDLGEMVASLNRQ